jgi:cardiolipin synthase
VYLTTPYFIPDLRLLQTIRNAAKRGVDVRLLIPASSDYRVIDYSVRSYFTLLLNTGVKIYEYTPHMLHAKTAVIDGSWGTIGTFNLDNLSSTFNHELNIACTDSSFAMVLRDQFLKDIEVSRSVNFEEWKNRSPMNKLKEFITWPFHKIL